MSLFLLPFVLCLVLTALVVNCKLTKSAAEDGTRNTRGKVSQNQIRKKNERIEVV